MVYYSSDKTGQELFGPDTFANDRVDPDAHGKYAGTKLRWRTYKKLVSQLAPVLPQGTLFVGEFNLGLLPKYVIEYTSLTSSISVYVKSGTIAVRVKQGPDRRILHSKTYMITNFRYSALTEIFDAIDQLDGTLK